MLLAAQGMKLPDVVWVVVGLVAVLAGIGFLIVLLNFGRLWVTALSAKADVGLLELIGM